MSQRHIAMRMCMGCGGRAPQPELLRVSLTPAGELVIARRQPAGRSGYLHRQPACWNNFAARKGPLRSLGRSVEKAARAGFVQGLQQVEQVAQQVR